MFAVGAVARLLGLLLALVAGLVPGTSTPTGAVAPAATPAPARVPAAPAAPAQRPAALRPGLAARPASVPALAQDAPDPDVVLAGSTFYAFTTGAIWGDEIGLAVDTTGDPSSGWQTAGSAFGTTNGHAPAAWEQNESPTSPSVVHLGNRWVMFYDAFDTAAGWFCLSEASSPTVNGPYVDSSSGPLECQPELGGSIDPHVFVDPSTGVAYLQWKNNAGLCQGYAYGYCPPGQHAPTEPSHVWSSQLTPDGAALVTAPRAIFTIDTTTYPWQTTTDDPSMILAGGRYYLFFSGGDYQSNYYPVAYVLCAGPLGGCDQSEPDDPVLTGEGGTGSGMEFTDLTGAWWIAYSSWRPDGCTSYRSGCARDLFVTPLALPPQPAPGRLPARSAHR